MKPSLKGLLFSPLPKPGYAVEKRGKSVDSGSKDDEGSRDIRPDHDGSNSDSTSSDSSDSDSES
jgi:hypothetical protein